MRHRLNRRGTSAGQGIQGALDAVQHFGFRYHRFHKVSLGSVRCGFEHLLAEVAQLADAGIHLPANGDQGPIALVHQTTVALFLAADLFRQVIDGGADFPEIAPHGQLYPGAQIAVIKGIGHFYHLGNRGADFPEEQKGHQGQGN